MSAGIASESHVVVVPHKGSAEGVSKPECVPSVMACSLHLLRCTVITPECLQLWPGLRALSHAPLMPNAPWSACVNE